MRIQLLHPVVVIAVVSAAAFAASAACGQPAHAADPVPSLAATRSSPPALVALNPEGTVLLDAANHQVVVKSKVVLREGLLEMLACLKHTKEHEAVLAIDAKASTIHAALLAAGFEAGEPVSFFPEYRAATGPILDISLRWTTESGEVVTKPAQSLIRNATRRYFVEKLKQWPAGLNLPADSDLKWDEKHNELLWYGPMQVAQRDALLALTKNAEFRAAISKFYEETRFNEMKADWVFAGSRFDKNLDTGEPYYLAESGDVICVANFATAMIDLAIASSAAGETLLYEAYTERIPPVGTEVEIILSKRAAQ